jgi:Tetrapyrrole (Corrin/Porphyrin) Methylases
MLVVSGTGILGVGHITLETLGYIKEADITFSVIADPVTDQFLQETARQYSPLHVLYRPGEDRQPVYDAMVAYVVDSLSDHDLVCALFYGHPGVFVNPSRRMVRLARERGHAAKLLPGISAIDSLFTDVHLGVIGDPTFQPERTHGPRLDVLAERLARIYPLSHELILYEASPFVVAAPRIDTISLADLPAAQASGLTTLYVPSIGRAPRDEDMARRLNLG